MKRRLCSLLLAVMMTTSMALPALAAEQKSEDTATTTAAETTSAETDAEAITGKIAEIMKYGNLILDIKPETLLEAGFAYGDVLNINIDGTDYEVPFGTAYGDVDVGNSILRHVQQSGEGSGQLVLAIFMGDFANTNKIAESYKDESGETLWKDIEGATPYKEMPVTITMKEKEGYLEEYIVHQATANYSDDRADFASNEIFANFRNVDAGILGKNAFYRSASPIDPKHNRAAYANELAKRAGIGAFINLANTKANVEEFAAADTFHSPYYMSRFNEDKVLTLGLGVDFTSDDFKKGMVEMIRFIGNNEGPYLVHCTEGKDRAGFASMLIGVLMGASPDEVITDYMTTFENYFNIKSTDDVYTKVMNTGVIGMLKIVSGLDSVADLEGKELMDVATKYLTDAGATEEEIEKAIENLSKDYPAPTLALDKDTPFTDMPAASNDYYIPIDWAYVYGLTTGSNAEGTTFTPGGDAYRGDFVTLLFRYLAASGSGKNPFTDVTDDYMIKPVAWASTKGYVKGLSATQFGPKNVVTRGQVITILYRIAGEPEVTEGADAAKAYTDVVKGSYYEDAVVWGVANNIVKGLSDTSFGPDGTCTRAQMMTFIYRARDLLKVG